MPPGRRFFDPGHTAPARGPIGVAGHLEKGAPKSGSALRTTWADAGPTPQPATVHLRRRDRQRMLRLMPVPAFSNGSPPSGDTDDGR